MIKLYDLKCKNDNFSENDIKGMYVKNNGHLGPLHSGDVLDFLTYFNSFSAIKWSKYTTIKKVVVDLFVHGEFQIFFVLQDKKGKRFLLCDRISNEHYVREFPIEKIQEGVLGFELKALSDGAAFVSGAYYGEFDSFSRKSIGIGICTFKREKYVQRNIEVLKQITQEIPEIETLVVDNGRTLTAQVPGVRIIPNKNFGGSGGFTRSIIEYMERKNRVDYILLMDDDVVIEPSAVLRTWVFLGGLREEYRDRFLSGAMLIQSRPCVQYENSAYWNRIRLRSKGRDMDMRNAENLVLNECESRKPNQYGAWWYCCIPTQRVTEIGYPLPVFIKGDDIEFGLRNDRPVITMNGIAVWHQDFADKISLVQNYYLDRNMPMMNSFAGGCNILTFAIAVWGRMFLRLRLRDKDIAKIFYLSLYDYNKGLEEITKIGADEKLQDVKEYTSKKSSSFIFAKVVLYSLYTVAMYPRTHKKCLEFREQKLKDTSFWKKYLGLA